MGGKNHAPTGNMVFVGPSALLSRRVGEGYIAVIRANNHLEDAVVLSVKKRNVESETDDINGTASEHLRDAIEDLETSVQTLQAIAAAFDHLIKVAEVEGYSGNPLASQLPTLDLKTLFSSDVVTPVIHEEAWSRVEERITNDNILKTLEWEKGEFLRLAEPTQELLACLHDCLSIEQRYGGQEFVERVEHNQLPLRRLYARVFSMWNHLDALFLYSALITTELFYRSSELGSLAGMEDSPR